MTLADNPEAFVTIFRDTVVSMIREDHPDLTSRQLGVFLTCYLDSEAQTVRGLASTLDVSKPVISRALDRLAGFDLVRRKVDPNDRRSIFVLTTHAGDVYLKKVRMTLATAAKAGQKSSRKK